jgi:starvation-inducible DNA-binding protein
MKNEDLKTTIENPLKETTTETIKKVLKGNKSNQSKKMQKVERKFIKRSVKALANKTKKQTTNKIIMKTIKGKIESHSQAVADELAKVLADENVLYIKTKNAHWNVEGPDFYDKHKLFEIQFGQLDELIDAVAERIRSIGHYAPGSLQSYLDLTHLTEQTRTKNDSQGFISELLSDHESIIAELKGHIKSFSDDYQDYGSCDFITGLMETHEKMAWFLRSHLKN